jgi:Flp pilus assembly protein TadB
MTAAALLGIGFALGVTLVLSGLRPMPVPLDEALAELRRTPGSLAMPRTGEPAGVLTRVLGPALSESAWGRRVTHSAAADLRITGLTAAEHLSTRVSFAAAAGLWAPLAFGMMAVGGVNVGFVLPLWLSIALVPVGFLYPTLQLRAKAADRRRSFRHALSAFLDVVSISLAGGRGVDSALHHAAESGHGWAFDELRGSLLEARLQGDTPWAGLARLGHDLDVPELGELAASASLAGAEGARVRSSLAAKAKALRLRGLTEIEAAAQSASERMSLPIVALMLGFIVFVAYPAIDKVLNGL